MKIKFVWWWCEMPLFLKGSDLFSVMYLRPALTFPNNKILFRHVYRSVMSLSSRPLHPVPRGIHLESTNKAS